jgi:hypothetical protein
MSRAAASRCGRLAIHHKVFFEKYGTAAGVIVGDESSDPGLLHVDPVGIDADHLGICKPADASDLVYTRTRDFIVDEIIPFHCRLAFLPPVLLRGVRCAVRAQRHAARAHDGIRPDDRAKCLNLAEIRHLK